MKNPQLGDKAICKMCDKEIEYIGSYWRHIGLPPGVQPRHPAWPTTRKEKKESDWSKIMVHLNHPCREIDVWHLESESQFEIARRQGYIPLEYLKKSFAEYQHIRKIILGDAKE